MIVLITGASSGVGAATARLFARDGATVIMVARRDEILQSLATEIGQGAIAMACDAGDPEAVSAMADTVMSEYGVPDLVINSAGAGVWKTVQDTTPQEAQVMMQAPYFAAFYVTQAFLGAMLQRGSGHVVHVNSPACMVAWPSSVGYAATRAALRGFHEALWQDLVGTNVHSSHVIFGQIDSEYFTTNTGTAEKLPALARTMPVLSTQHCARILKGVANHPRHTKIYPWMLRLQLAFARWFPRLTRRLARL